MTVGEPTSIVALLERLAREAELQGAHEVEFVPDRHPVDRAVQAALQAAVSFGRALGIREAVALVANGGQAHSLGADKPPGAGHEPGEQGRERGSA